MRQIALSDATQAILLVASDGRAVAIGHQEIADWLNANKTATLAQVEEWLRATVQGRWSALAAAPSHTILIHVFGKQPLDFSLCVSRDGLPGDWWRRAS